MPRFRDRHLGHPERVDTPGGRTMSGRVSIGFRAGIAGGLGLAARALAIVAVAGAGLATPSRASGQASSVVEKTKEYWAKLVAAVENEMHAAKDEFEKLE